MWAAAVRNTRQSLRPRVLAGNGFALIPRLPFDLTSDAHASRLLDDEATLAGDECATRARTPAPSGCRRSGLRGPEDALSRFDTLSEEGHVVALYQAGERRLAGHRRSRRRRPSIRPVYAEPFQVVIAAAFHGGVFLTRRRLGYSENQADAFGTSANEDGRASRRRARAAQVDFDSRAAPFAHPSPPPMHQALREVPSRMCSRRLARRPDKTLRLHPSLPAFRLRDPRSRCCPRRILDTTQRTHA